MTPRTPLRRATRRAASPARSYGLDRASAVGGVRPPFKPCVRISRTRLTKGHWEYDITQPPGSESSRAGDGDRAHERSPASTGPPDRREDDDRGASGASVS